MTSHKHRIADRAGASSAFLTYLAVELGVVVPEDVSTGLTTALVALFTGKCLSLVGAWHRLVLASQPGSSHL